MGCSWNQGERHRSTPFSSLSFYLPFLRIFSLYQHSLSLSSLNADWARRKNTSLPSSFILLSVIFCSALSLFTKILGFLYLACWSWPWLKVQDGRRKNNNLFSFVFLSLIISFIFSLYHHSPSLSFACWLIVALRKKMHMEPRGRNSLCYSETLAFALLFFTFLFLFAFLHFTNILSRFLLIIRYFCLHKLCARAVRIISIYLTHFRSLFLFFSPLPTFSFAFLVFLALITWRKHWGRILVHLCHLSWPSFFLSRRLLAFRFLQYLISNGVFGFVQESLHSCFFFPCCGWLTEWLTWCGRGRRNCGPGILVFAFHFSSLQCTVFSNLILHWAAEE